MVPEKDTTDRTTKPSKKVFVVVILVITTAIGGLTAVDMPVATSVEVVAASLTAVEAARRLTAAKAAVPVTGTAD
ncbi:hypothetical protein [Streptomyces sp. NPDC021212]|uniref:hypothetical protein n=1 Tax=Streptomyces sp. NPDC021212 TaxID=3365118 RepID=UPI0037963BE2